MGDPDALLAAAEAIAHEADQRLAREAIRSAIAIAPRIVEFGWNSIELSAQPIWTVRLAPRRQVTDALLTRVLADLGSARCRWAWGSSPVAGLASCLIEIPDGPSMELMFTLPRLVGELTYVARQGVMCLATEPLRSNAEGRLLGNIVSWQIDGHELARVVNTWLAGWRPILRPLWNSDEDEQPAT